MHENHNRAIGPLEKMTTTLVITGRVCDNYRMAKRMITDQLTATLRRAIVESELPIQTLAKATGIQRMSLDRFASGKQSLRLDVAGKLAAYFGLELKRKG